MICSLIRSTSAGFSVTLKINILSAAVSQPSPALRQASSVGGPLTPWSRQTVPPPSTAQMCSGCPWRVRCAHKSLFSLLPLFVSTLLFLAFPSPPPASHHWACRAQLPLAGVANTKKSCSCEPRTSRHKRTRVALCTKTAAVRQGERWEQAGVNTASRSQQPDSR